MRNLLLLLSLIALAAVAIFSFQEEDSSSLATPPLLENASNANLQNSAMNLEQTNARIPGSQGQSDVFFLRVLHSDGRAPDNAVIHVFPWEGEPYILTAEQGRQTLLRAGPGFSIAALADGVWSKPLQLDSDDRKQTSELLLLLGIPAGSLQVSVVDPIGLAVENFDVDLEWAGPLKAQERSNVSAGSLLRTQLPDPDSAVFSQLPPGNWTASVRVPQYPEAVASAAVASGEVVPLRIQLRGGGTVRGIVQDSEGNALANASVFLLAEGIANLAHVLSESALQSLAPKQGIGHSDALGMFSLGPVEAGTWQLSALAKGYSSYQSPQIELASQSDHDLGAIQLEAGGDIHLLLLRREDQSPVEAAHAEWIASSNSPWLNSLAPWTEVEQTSNPNGQLTLMRLPSGKVQIRLTASGLAPHVLEVQPGTATGVQTIFLDPALALYGKVLAQNTSKPIAGAQVTASLKTNGFFSNMISQAASAGRDRTTTEPDGSFQFLGLSAGEWTLSVSAEEWAPISSTPLSLDAEKNPSPVELRLNKGATIRVLVLDENGLPEADAIVSAFSYNNAGAPPSESTTVEGVAILKNIPAGTWQLTAISESQAMQALGALSGNFSGLETRTAFLNTEEGSEHELTLGGIIPRTMVRGFVMRGAVPAEDMAVMLSGSAGMKSTRTDDIGYYELEDVPVGNWIMLVGNFGMTGGSGWIGSLVVQDGGTQEKNVDLPGGSVEVLVLDAANGTPVANTTVAIRPAEGTSGGGWLRTDDQGVVLFDTLQSGNYILSVGHMAMPLFGNSSDHGASFDGPFIFDGESHLKKELSIGSGCALQVEVTDSFGTPVSGAGIFILTSSGHAINQLSMQGTDAKGQLDLDGLPSGAFRILARHPSGQVEKPLRLSAGNPNKLSLRLESGCMLRVWVTDKEGLPMKGVQAVALDSRNTPISALYSGTEAMAVGMAFMQGGEQALGPLSPGSYTLLLSTLSGQAMRIPVEVPAGQENLRKTIVFQP